MKTPMQELIETFEEMKDPNVESSIDVDFAISLIKSMLKKEKEVMCEFTLDYLKEINLIINEKLIKEINRRIEVRKFDADNDKEVYAECCVLQDIRELINKQY